MSKKLAVAAVLLLAPSLSFGAGFALYEVGARSFAMANAFTAVADDPSALFFNPAGIAFQTDEGSQLMLGLIYILPEQDFWGESPYPGEGYKASQTDLEFVVPHVYLVIPLGERTSFGFSVLAPFGLGTKWEDDFLGRYLSRDADIMAIDFSPNLAFKVTDGLSFAIGVDYRTSTIELVRDVGLLDPFSQQVVDVAESRLETTGSGNDGWGWHAGLLAHLGAGFSLGVSYRSEVEVKYEGEASFTQYNTGNPQLDAIVATLLPAENLQGVTKIDFPDNWNVGIAWSNEKWTLSGQWARMGWSSHQGFDLIFPENPEFNETLVDNYSDADQYSFGLEHRAGPKWRFQLGYQYDETPQPIETMSPLLGDGDRRVYAFGFGWQGKRIWLDFGYQYVQLLERSTQGTAIVGYDGSYAGDAHLFATSFGWKF